jgi:hypothetical protein
MKEPKIVQMIGDSNGTITGVLYDDGRIFYWEPAAVPAAWHEFVRPAREIPKEPARGRRVREKTN